MTDTLNEYGGDHDLADDTETLAPTRPPATPCGAKHPAAACARFAGHDGAHRGYGFSINVPLAWTDAEALALWFDAETTWRQQVPVWLDAEATWWREEGEPWLEAEAIWREQLDAWLDAEASWRWLEAEAIWRDDVTAWLAAEATWRDQHDDEAPF